MVFLLSLFLVDCAKLRQFSIVLGNLKPVLPERSMQEDSTRSPSYTVACEDYVHVVEFSPFSSGTPASLLAYGGNQYVVVGTCLFQVRNAVFHSSIYLLHSLFLLF